MSVLSAFGVHVHVWFQLSTDSLQFSVVEADIYSTWWLAVVHAGIKGKDSKSALVNTGVASHRTAETSVASSAS